MDAKSWFYIEEGKRHGPVGAQELIAKLCALQDPHAVPVWAEGVPRWTPAGELEGLANRLPPPLPGSVSTAVQSTQQPSAPPVRPTSTSDPDGPVGIGGWLLFLCIGLTLVNPLGIAYVAELVTLAQQDFPGAIKVWLGANALVALGLILWGLIAGITLWRRNPDGIGWTKKFLWSCAAWPFLAGLWGAAAGLPLEVVSGVFGAGLPLAIPAAIWTAYLNRSKRVANTYRRSLSEDPNAEATNVCPPAGQQEQPTVVDTETDRAGVGDAPPSPPQQRAEPVRPRPRGDDPFGTVGERRRASMLGCLVPVLLGLLVVYAFLPSLLASRFLFGDSAQYGGSSSRLTAPPATSGRREAADPLSPRSVPGRLPLKLEGIWKGAIVERERGLFYRFTVSFKTERSGLAEMKGVYSAPFTIRGRPTADEIRIEVEVNDPPFLYRYYYGRWDGQALSGYETAVVQGTSADPRPKELDPFADFSLRPVRLGSETAQQALPLGDYTVETVIGDQERELPKSELVNLRQVAAWSGETLELTVNNGSTYRVTEIYVTVERFEGGDLVEDEAPILLLPPEETVEDGVAALLNKVPQEWAKPGINPHDTGRFVGKIGPAPEAFRCALVSARGYALR